MINAVKNMLVSVKASFRSLNFPMYDGAVSSKARKLLASGKVDGAFTEYERLSGLGSGKARCILAYAHLLGTQRFPRDLVAARALALSAESSEFGFSNFILGCIDLENREISLSLKRFYSAAEAGFFPALTNSAILQYQAYELSEKQLKMTERRFFEAIGKGHFAAFLPLAIFYARGKLGLLHRVIGLALFPIAIVSMHTAYRLRIFSLASFFYHPSFRELCKVGRNQSSSAVTNEAEG